MIASNAPLRVGVSGINALDNPGPGIAIARSLKEDTELNVQVIGLAYDAMEPGIYMDWVVDRSCMVPYPSGNSEAYFARLIDIKQRCGMDHIIPNLDAELPFYIKYASRLAQACITTFLPSMQQYRLRGKDQLIEIADRIGVKLPMTRVVTSVQELTAAIDAIGLPVMVKGAFYHAHRAYTAQEAVGHYHALVADWGYPIICQQIVTGEEFNVVGVGDGEGKSLGLVAVKKVWTTSSGKMWTGLTVDHQPMLDAAERFVQMYKWRGPFELECIVVDEDVYLIEINPRFPAWTYLATGVGVNLPSMLLRATRQMDLPKVEKYEAGRMFVRYSYDMVTDMRSFQNMMIHGGTQ